MGILCKGSGASRFIAFRICGIPRRSLLALRATHVGMRRSFLPLQTGSRTIVSSYGEHTPRWGFLQICVAKIMQKCGGHFKSLLRNQVSPAILWTFHDRCRQRSTRKQMFHLPSSGLPFTGIRIRDSGEPPRCGEAKNFQPFSRKILILEICQCLAKAWLVSKK